MRQTCRTPTFPFGRHLIRYRLRMLDVVERSKHAGTGSGHSCQRAELTQPDKCSVDFAVFPFRHRLQIVATVSENNLLVRKVRNYGEWRIACQPFIGKNCGGGHMHAWVNHHEGSRGQRDGCEFFADALGEGVLAEHKEGTVRSDSDAWLNRPQEREGEAEYTQLQP